MSETPIKRQVTVDPDRFDDLQRRVLQEIVRDVDTALKESVFISPEKRRELTEMLAFQIAAIVDGSRAMTLKGKLVQPILTFAADEEAVDLISADGSSWMHEYAIGMVEEYFEKIDARTRRVWMLRLEMADPAQTGMSAYTIGLNLAKDKAAALKELKDDARRFKRTKISLSAVAKAFLVTPAGRKRKFDLKKLAKTGVTAEALYGIFCAADRKA